MIRKLLIFLGSTLLLSGCTYAKDTLSTPPEIKWEIPETIEVKIDTEMVLSISNKEQTAWKEEDLSLTLRKQGEEKTIPIPFETINDEKIMVNHSFPSEGIYYLTSTLKTEKISLQPVRLIVVGEVVESEDVKKSEEEEDSTDHSGHH
ncbi:hypothetical protein JOC95_001537 [Bacillus tianshenii]|uniref:YtkA-like domain-containing protein n=1 Tax=Sutcliffiella tianshenii TaxID=1463404 RepID=A0ABS2NZT2_9BACI|nr:hypothetical protein [Bacillus tianshenii]MBM7619685.1 hypothetical protein [Bacillus tianshenii]